MQRVFPILIMLALMSSGAWAAHFYSFQVSNSGDTYRAHADIYLAAPLPQVYQVLTDFNHLTRIGGVIRKSRVLKQLDSHTYLVFVKGHICVLFFCRDLRETQRVVEKGDRELEAQALPAQSNVKMSSSHWRLQPQGQGTRMHWKFILTPNFWVPPLIGPFLMKNGIRKQAQRMAYSVEKLARERAHLPPLTRVNKHAPGS